MKAKEYYIGSVCKTLGVWGKLFEIEPRLLRYRINKKGMSLIEAICYVSPPKGKPNFKHGRTSKKGRPYYLYKLWDEMKQRCFNPNSISYKNYGARGITMYQPWVDNYQSFENYILGNLGERPEEHSIDRIDTDGNYEPGNIRWANNTIQAITRRKSKRNKSGVVGVSWNRHRNKWLAHISIKGKSKCIGAFHNKEDAIKTRLRAEEKYYKPLLSS
ncbi:MAG: hypothetical protein AAF378_22155 [Cyanobacteria bacterium P01_A01_bin.84]